MSATTTYVRRSDLHAVDMDGEIVMMGVDQGQYFGLRDVAASLWRALAEPCTVDELVAAVVAEYDVAPEQCRPDVESFVAHLVEQSLVTETV